MQSSDAGAAALDPLCADAICANVPAMNARKDVSSLVGALRSIAPTRTAITQLSHADCLAAMRDLGLILGSLKRHGIEPLAAVPELQPALISLGARTSMIPRDTVYHYGPWNPAGKRQRMYLGTHEEDTLIQSVRIALPQVESATVLLQTLLDLPPDEAAFASILEKCARHLESMVRAIDLVRAEVTPNYFAQVMRPYFEPILVANTSYFGPAAAHMPLYLVDSLLWSANHSGPAHSEFQHSMVAYSPPRWRSLLVALAGQQSITSRVLQAVADAGENPNPALRESVRALCKVFRVLITFRGRHMVIARAAYHVERRLYATGSGGETVGLLEEILNLTREYAAAVQPHSTVASIDACEGNL
jgi:monodechloroaminopyrrolnitrin synthase